MKSTAILEERLGLVKVCFILFLSHSLSLSLVVAAIDFFMVVDRLFEKKKKKRGCKVVLMVEYQDKDERSYYISLGLSMRRTWLCG
jgi:hypothetical protein